MENKHFEPQIYQLQHSSTNDPLLFIEEFNKHSSAYKNIRLAAKNLCYIRALLFCGRVPEALSKMDELGKELHKDKDSFLLAKYNLLLYNILNLAHPEEHHKAEYHYREAEKHVTLSGSKALACEWKLAQVQRTDLGLSLEEKEELLQEAMREANEADIVDLKLEVYLANCPLYMSNNLLDKANHELLLLLDMVDETQNPYLYTQACNYLGVLYMMLKEYERSIEFLNKGIAVARMRGFKPQLANIIMNLGVNYLNRGRIQDAIAKYQDSETMLGECGLADSATALKCLDNHATALGRLERYEESITLMRDSLIHSKETGNTDRENNLKVNLANTLIEIEGFAEAEQLLKEAVTYFTEQDNKLLLSIAYRCTGRLFEAKGCFEEAFGALEMLDVVSRQYFNENFFKQSSQYNARIEKLRHEYLQLKGQCCEAKEFSSLALNAELVGEHPLIKKALKDAFMAAKYGHVHVLITGESGTGKEVIAGIIHNASNTGKALVAVNASAISPNLVESELFGHKKGAFTGAVEDRKGKFLVADKGTLLLDEIADMPLDVQVKLLRAIETHRIQPVGSDREIPVNCRIISTTNYDLKELVRQSKFRLDLYHRLNKVEIFLPPLRERKSDLPLLTMHFVKHFSNVFRVPVPQITEEFWQRLEAYSFPGNIRELMNIIERIYILKPGLIWHAGQLDGIIGDSPISPPAEGNMQNNLKQVEYHIILSALEKSGWVQKDTAKLLNMAESTLSRKIKNLGIKR